MEQDNSSAFNKIKLHRFVFFTDAVLAIILTLLVIELHLPELINSNSSGEMIEKLWYMAPHFASFLLCFLQLASAWLGFNLMDSLIKTYDNTLGILRLMMLLPLSLMPFASSLIGNYLFNPVSFAFFGFIGIWTSIIQVNTLKYLWKKEMYVDELDRQHFKDKVLKRVWIFPIVSTFLMGVAFINTYIAFAIYLVMNLIGIVSMRWLKFTKTQELISVNNTGS